MGKYVFYYLFVFNFAIIRVFVFYKSKSTFFSIYLHELSLRCQHRCHHSYPGTLLFNKSHICIFISKYLLFKWYASLSSYNSSTKIFILQRGYTDRDYITENLSDLVDWSHSISKVGRFLKTNWMCLGFLHTSMLNYYWEIVYCDLSFVDEFVRKWRF